MRQDTEALVGLDVERHDTPRRSPRASGRGECATSGGRRRLGKRTPAYGQAGGAARARHALLLRGPGYGRHSHLMQRSLVARLCGLRVAGSRAWWPIGWRGERHGLNN